MLVRGFEDGSTIAGCCLTVVPVAGIWDIKLVVATAGELWITLSGAKLCREKGFFVATVLHPL